MQNERHFYTIVFPVISIFLRCLIFLVRRDLINAGRRTTHPALSGNYNGKGTNSSGERRKTEMVRKGILWVLSELIGTFQSMANQENKEMPGKREGTKRLGKIVCPYGGDRKPSSPVLGPRVQRPNAAGRIRMSRGLEKRSLSTSRGNKKNVKNMISGESSG